MTAPERITLNLLDLSFLMPETDDLNGVHLPASLTMLVTLREPPELEQVVTALRRLVEQMPELRIGYRLEFARNQWARVPELEIESYLMGLVQVDLPDAAPEQVLAAELAMNTPLPQPLVFILQGRRLYAKMHHSFGDGLFHTRLVSALLTAMYAPDKLASLPHLAGYGLPLWRLIFQNPARGLRTWARGLKAFVPEQLGYGASLEMPTLDYHVEPIVSGSTQGVALHTIPAGTVARLNKLRKALSNEVKISLNTLLNMLVAQRLVELGCVKQPVLFSIPVSLARYLPDGGGLYAGNLASRLRVTGYAPGAEFQAACEALQAQVEQQLADETPLVGIPGASITAINRSVYRRMNGRWSVNANAINKDPRFFNLTNYGDLSAEFEHLAAHVDLTAGVFSAVPLMGRPPLVLNVNSVAGQGNVTITYNPAILCDEQVKTIAGAFDADAIETKLVAAGTAGVSLA